MGLDGLDCGTGIEPGHGTRTTNHTERSPRTSLRGWCTSRCSPLLMEASVGPSPCTSRTRCAQDHPVSPLSPIAQSDEDRRGFARPLHTTPPPFALTQARFWFEGRGVLKRGKKMFLNGCFAKRPRVAHMFNHGWWRLAVGGWRLAVGDWRLVAVGGGWRRLVVGDWWLVAVGSGWRLAVGRRWRLAAVGGWQLVRLVVGGWWSLVAVPKGGP